MDKFISLQGIAAPLPIVNIDTDMIIPKQFLKTIKRTGLGVSLFYEMRYDNDGKLIKDFVLNTSPYDQSKILVAGDNFGCGSSREHAPWSLKDFGIRCVISTSFADIFYNNCFKNGVLPVILTESEVDELFQELASDEGYHLDIDLEVQTVTTDSGKVFSFELDEFRKECLLIGLDEIGLTLTSSDLIKEYEIEREKQHPWVFGAIK